MGTAQSTWDGIRHSVVHAGTLSLRDDTPRTSMTAQGQTTPDPLLSYLSYLSSLIEAHLSGTRSASEAGHSFTYMVPPPIMSVLGTTPTTWCPHLLCRCWVRRPLSGARNPIEMSMSASVMKGPPAPTKMPTRPEA